MYSCKIVKDSISPLGIRLTTFEVSFPRIVLAEFNTHRVFSRNSASSRAIPVEKMLKRVLEDPFIPIYWGKNQKGMQAAEELSLAAQALALEQWLLARDNAVAVVQRLQMPDIDLHKQIANRLLEPWLWHTVIVTSTEWANFFALRCDKNAQPEIQTPAKMMKEAYDAGMPERLSFGQWHLPMIYEEGDELKALYEKFDTEGVIQISIGRCARVSYLTHDGKRDPEADVYLSKSLLKNGHMSPFEHAATPMAYMSDHVYKKQGSLWSGNHRGWIPYRSTIKGEDIFGSTVAG